MCSYTLQNLDNTKGFAHRRDQTVVAYLDPSLRTKDDVIDDHLRIDKYSPVVTDHFCINVITTYSLMIVNTCSQSGSL